MDSPKEIIQGEHIQCLIRIKPNISQQKQNIKILGKNLCIMDNNKRVIEEIQSTSVFGSEMPLLDIYQSHLQQYIGPLLQGFNVSLCAFGQQSSGKTYLLFENKKEQGFAQQLIEGVFSLLKAKSRGRGEYEYSVRIRAVEIEDEQVKDLLSEHQESVHLGVIADEWEGTRLDQVSWTQLTDSHTAIQFIHQVQLNRKKYNSSSACIVTLEVIQNLQLDKKSKLVLASRLNIIDLPADDILLDSAESVKVEDGNTIHKAIFSLANLIQQLYKGNTNPVLYYDNSVLTRLMKDVLGGNALTISVFCIEQGDYQKNLNTISYYKMMAAIMNYPIVNDSKALGLIRKMRAEAIYHSGKEDYQERNVNIVEMEKRLIEHNLDSLRQNEEKQQLSTKVGDLRNQYNALVQQKNTFQNELIRSEQEKLEVSKALVDLQMENTKLMEVLQNEKYELNYRIMNQEGDILQQNIKEEMALKEVAQMREQVDELKSDRKDMEVEFIALKKNYLRVRSDYEQEKDKNQQLGLELINSVNRNKALQEEMNDIFQKTGEDSEQKTRFGKQVERLEGENRELKEAMVFAQAQVEKLKTQLMKYDLLDKQNQLEMEQRTVQMERHHLEQGKQDANQRQQWTLENNTQQQNMKDYQQQWESQKMTLVQQLKTAHRKALAQQNSIEQLTKDAQFNQQELSKLQLEMDEMRTVYRQKLQQYVELSGKEDQQVNLSIKSKQELLRTYSIKEQELQQRVQTQSNNERTMKKQITGLQAYSRQLKALAEDWAPLGMDLPDILRKGEEAYIQYETNNGLVNTSHVQEQVFKLQKENQTLKQQQNYMAQSNPKAEIQQMANNQLMEQGNKKILEMQEENSRLVKMLKENKKWDIYLMQKENSRLIETVRVLERKESISPQSGDNDNLRQKLIYFDRIVRQLEQERSELIVRATMAEEQLKSMTDLVHRKSRGGNEQNPSKHNFITQI